jgi:hypothetical protein
VHYAAPRSTRHMYITSPSVGIITRYIHTAWRFNRAWYANGLQRMPEVGQTHCDGMN